jgi:hypothetical protein
MITYIKAWNDGRCYDAYGAAGSIAELKKYAESRQVTIESGKCVNAKECRTEGDNIICRSSHKGNYKPRNWNKPNNKKVTPYVRKLKNAFYIMSE